MNADKRRFDRGEETHRIIGAAMEVHNTLGAGFHEKPYENALVEECHCQGISAAQQPRFPIHYKGKQVGEYIPDLILFDCIIVDTKVIESITDREIGQMLNYLKITGLTVGLILNFKHPKLTWKRIAHAS